MSKLFDGALRMKKFVIMSVEELLNSEETDNLSSILRDCYDAISTYSPDYMHGSPKIDYLNRLEAQFSLIDEKIKGK